MHDFLAAILEWYRSTLEHGGYGTVILLMAAESTIVPLPSEAIIPFAAHYAAQKGEMSVAGVVLAGAFGSWLGATIMYWAARLAGRPLVLRYGKYFFVPPAKVEAAERWASNFGNFGIFASRLLPVVRHLIGVPAGIVRMSYPMFSLYTLIGSGLWCGVLAWVGVKAGQDEQLKSGNFGHLALWVGGGVAVLGVIYYLFVYRHMKAEKK